MTTTKKLGGRTNFTEAAVEKYKLPPQGAQIDYFEKLMKGRTLVLRLSYGGSKTWRVGYYVNGRPRAKSIGHYPELKVAAARKAAREFDPKAAYAAAQAGNFREVAESWLRLYVHDKKRTLRTAPEIERILRVYVYPHWAGRPFFEIKRLDVNTLLDKLVEKHGAPQADAVLKVLRGIMNWFQTRDDNYVSPIVKGMHRDKREADERARDRILTDDEIRAVWAATEELGRYGALVRILLLTAQRLGKVSAMRWSDISEEGVWTIPSEAREKGDIGSVRLPSLALDIIRAQPQLDSNAFIFTSLQTYRRRHKAGDRSSPPPKLFGKPKELTAKLPGMNHWTLHDLRRTARSLMASDRCGVADHIAERVLGHKIKGIERTYNRHGYFNEKSAALQKLATLIEQIINPPDTGNVVELKAHRIA
jgi:integrase